MKATLLIQAEKCVFKCHLLIFVDVLTFQKLLISRVESEFGLSPYSYSLGVLCPSIFFRPIVSTDE